MLYNTNHGKLNKEEELEMIKRSQAGDLKARQKLVETNILLIFKVARKFGLLRAKDGPNNEDIFQDGLIGLLTAIDKFDVNSGLRLSTYSTHWIRTALQRPIQRGDYTGCMSHPVHHSKILNILKSIEVELNHENVFDEYLKEIDRRGIKNVFKEKQVLATFEYGLTIALSGNSRGFNVEGETYDEEFFDTITLDKELTPEEIHQRQSFIDKVNYMLEDAPLTEREEYIIRARYGIGFPEPQSLEEVGEAMNLTRERIRQIQVIALKKFQKYLEFEGITEIKHIM